MCIHFRNFLIIFLAFIILVGCTTETISINENNMQGTNTLTNEAEQNKLDDILKVHYINVEQADSTLLQFTESGKNHTILIDAGDFNTDNVIQYLHSQHITNIDIAIGTHPDADHIGQLDKVITQFNVGEVWLSGNPSSSQTFQRVLEAIHESGAGYEEPRMGDHYEIGPLKIDVLYPKVLTGKTNEESISLKITYGDVRFVFTGDAAAENELEMIESGLNVEADILQLGHHGSSTSTSEEFLQAVKPKVAIYSAGNDNSYGHPHLEVVSLIQKSGMDLYGTNIHGTIIVTTDGNSYSINTEHNGKIKPTAQKDPETAKGTDELLTEISKDKPKNSCIDINHGSLEQVEKIIHIGPERAMDLIELRPYDSVDDLSRIKGIGPVRIKDIQSEGLACVGGLQ
ncbi:MBL fold metallo-hydrolase [Cytobacillus sp.]|uniref:MBL fold metallo-hydrolase n=1 Tax=Cytobacillus sp. TaxID=2675269 RepID=UPI0028BD51FB|nr:MBL fold metallo-hydrolase [Cytobacillus sp.]